MAQAKLEVLQMWATRTKCLYCKKRFDQPFVLPVEKPQPGIFQPNFSIEVLFHVQDTHGYPEDIFREWLVGSIYGQELGDFGIRANQDLAGLYKS